jgi:pectin methylesterase-like acyl-CoA thioesterase
VIKRPINRSENGVEAEVVFSAITAELADDLQTRGIGEEESFSEADLVNVAQATAVAVPGKKVIARLHQ